LLVGKDSADADHPSNEPAQARETIVKERDTITSHHAESLRAARSEPETLTGRSKADPRIRKMVFRIVISSTSRVLTQNPASLACAMH
jgi:hypothetical protein